MKGRSFLYANSLKPFGHKDASAVPMALALYYPVAGVAFPLARGGLSLDAHTFGTCHMHKIDVFFFFFSALFQCGSTPRCPRPKPKVTGAVVQYPRYLSCIIARRGQTSNALVTVVGLDGSTSTPIPRTFVVAIFQRYFYTTYISYTFSNFLLKEESTAHGDSNSETLGVRLLAAYRLQRQKKTTPEKTHKPAFTRDF